MAVKFKHYRQEGSGGGTVEYAPYLTFQSDESFSMNVASPGWNNLMEYSTDTTTWSTWDGSLISAVQNSDAYVIYLRGTGNMKVSTSDSTKFTITGVNVRCIGNIENLLDYATVANGEHPPMMDYSYSNMFQNCTSLTTAPELPATTLATSCCEYMFQNCTSLKVSRTQTGIYQHAWRIPTSGTISSGASFWNDNMLSGTGGTFTSSPYINTTYYLENAPV